MIYNDSCSIFDYNLVIRLHFRWVTNEKCIFHLPLLLLLPLYPELSEFSLLMQLLPAMLYGSSSSSGIGNRGRLFTFTGRCTIIYASIK